MKTTSCDILIIGGGSIGLNAAFALLQRGRSVTLLDAHSIGQGSSSGNAGHIVPSHIVPLAAPGVVQTALRWALTDPARSPFGLSLHLSPAYLSWLLQFARSCTRANVKNGQEPLKALGLLSAQRYAEIISRENFACSYRQSGLLFLYQTPQAYQEGQAEAELLRQNGLPAEVLTAQETLQREPLARPGLAGGVHFTGDASLNPTEFLRLLKERALSLGADLRENTPVSGFVIEKGTVLRVQTASEEFAPRLVILAAGAWSPRLGRQLGLNLPIQPARGYSLTAHSARLPAQALLLGERKVALTPFPEQGKLRITGRLEVGNMSTTPNPRWLKAIESAAREYLQLEEPLQVEETWAGLRPCTPTGLPLIGFAPGVKNLLLAAGHAMLGLSLGPGTGDLLARLAEGQSIPAPLRAFSPQ